MTAWVVLTSPEGAGAAVQVAADAGPVTALAVGSRELAEAVATAGAARVLWLEPAAGSAAESATAQVAALIVADGPALVLGGTGAQGRALLGAVAARLGAAVLSAVTSVTLDGSGLRVERAGLGGAVVQSVRMTAPVVALLATGLDEPAPSAPVDVAAVSADQDGGVRLMSLAPVEHTGGLAGAASVVSVGRGLRARDDLAMVEQLAQALGAQIGCSMPVADDLGWVPKDHYVGRSGQQVSPRLYLALGISGAPQHLEGIRGAKVVVAVNSDPQAPIFRRADYGVVGDLYEVVPALIDALAP